MKSEFFQAIVPGNQYLLDGKIPVVAIKPVNRSCTVYSTELPEHSIVLVERERLQSKESHVAK
jgi:hypothetical protein